MLAPGGDPRVEEGPQGEVEDNVVLVGTDDAKEIQFELWKIEIFDRESKLCESEMEEKLNYESRFLVRRFINIASKLVVELIKEGITKLLTR